MKGFWWKILSIILILYSILAGFIFPVPKIDILNESIRNVYYHVPIWFSMLFLMIISLINSFYFLNRNLLKYDVMAAEAAHTGIILSILGILTGSIWARFTWGTWWTSDTKLNGVAISFMMYLAYFLLRNAVDDEVKKARLSGIYNIFAFVMMIVFILILPRMSASLHPGNGGNPAFGKYDMDNTMRTVFYPAVIGWILLGIWIWEIRCRISLVKSVLNNS